MASLLTNWSARILFCFAGYSRSDTPVVRSCPSPGSSGRAYWRQYRVPSSHSARWLVPGGVWRAILASSVPPAEDVYSPGAVCLTPGGNMGMSSLVLVRHIDDGRRSSMKPRSSVRSGAGDVVQRMKASRYVARKTDVPPGGDYVLLGMTLRFRQRWPMRNRMTPVPQ